MQQHHTRAVAKLAVADGGAVGRGDGAACVMLPRGCGQLIVAAGIRFHVLISFLMHMWGRQAEKAKAGKALLAPLPTGYEAPDIA